MPTLIDTIFKIYDLRRNASSSYRALPFEPIPPHTPHTGPLTAAYSGCPTPRNLAKSSTFGHLKLSVFSGVAHSDFSSYFFCLSQTRSQARRAASRPFSDNIRADNCDYNTATLRDDGDRDRRSVDMGFKSGISAFQRFKKFSFWSSWRGVMSTS